ncbi:MAG: DEAD/DEAH box helicase family protein [Pyrinomonadaceae bacterium]
MPIADRTILFRFILSQFGYDEFEALQSHYDADELGADVADGSLIYQRLLNTAKFDLSDLKEYDENIIRHLEVINRHRNPKISLKYYQYFSLIFTEYYLDRYFDNADELAQSLTEFGKEFLEDKDFEVTKDELNLLAYWMATGSGKTLILHFNILQFRHYAKKYGKKFANIIFLTPSEGLSDQHLKDLAESGIEGDYYANVRDGSGVKVIDIHKIKEAASGQGVTISVDEFGRDNLLLVDEGHKGDKKEESVWRNLREKIARKGFTFEYSATFGQVSKELQEYYAQRIVFDYSYRYFHKDGYGKRYFIDNIADENALDAEAVKYRYLTLNLMAFLQQKLFFRLNKEAAQEHQIENPLQIYVGHTVNPKAKKNSAEDKENQEVISDVSLLIHFFKDFLGDRQKYEAIIQAVVDATDDFAKDSAVRFAWLFSQTKDNSEIYRLIVFEVFNSETASGLELHTISKARGEIGLQVKGSNPYFGLINIGDVSSFKTALKGEFEFLSDKITEPLFPNLSEVSSAPVNILIGARKFIEGWNNYRVSSIGLINFGKSEGSQIIQLFGRGVRLRGKENSLKRSTENNRSVKFLELVETLNVFGLNARYIKTFSDDLAKDGIATEFHTINVPVHLLRNDTVDSIDGLDLFTLKRREGAIAFSETEIFKLEFDSGVKPRLDLTTKRIWINDGQGQAVQQASSKVFSLDSVKGSLDFDQIYLSVLEYKRTKGFFNLSIGHEALTEIARSQFCEIITDKPFAVTSLRDAENLQKLAANILKKYTEAFYNSRKRKYEGGNLETVKLIESDPSVEPIDYTVNIATTDGQGAPIPNIAAVIAEVQKVMDNAAKKIGEYKNNTVLLNAWFDKHLFQPLLLDAGLQEPNKHITTISPKGLNKGERQFVKNLNCFVLNARTTNTYDDCEFFLLRNRTKSKGVGIYLSTAGGFYPDFLFWIKRTVGNKPHQYLTFVDPHGIRNEDGGFSSDRIQLFKYLREFQTHNRLPSDLKLSSFILSPTPFEKTTVKAWSNSGEWDIVMKECHDNHLIEMSQDGSATPFAYIKNIVDMILS